MKLLHGFGTALATLALSGCGAPPYTNVDDDQLKTLISQGVPLYDIRRPEEWRQTGVVAGSRTLTYFDANGKPNPEFMPRFTAEVGKNDPVVLICRSGNRTDVVARELVEQGYSKVYNVRHGISRWIGESNPVVKKGVRS